MGGPRYVDVHVYRLNLRQHTIGRIPTTILWQALVLDWGSLQSQALAWVSTLTLLAAVSQVFLRAAAVTEACARVPQLINSTCLTDDIMDPDRKYLVEYITASAAGFYVFNVRFSASVALRGLHFTGLVAVTLARMVPLS